MMEIEMERLRTAARSLPLTDERSVRLLTTVVERQAVLLGLKEK